MRSSESTQGREGWVNAGPRHSVILEQKPPGQPYTETDESEILTGHRGASKS